MAYASPRRCTPFRRTPFLVGRMSAKASEIVVIESSAPGPIPGPWNLQAMTRPARLLRLVRS